MLKQFNIKQQIFADPILVIDPKTGEQVIKTSGVDWIEIHTQDEINAISASITGGGEVWIKNGKLKTSGKAPTPYSIYNRLTGKWEISPEKQTALLEKQRQQVREQINALRDEKNRSGVYVEELDKWFDNDDLAYQNLLGFKASIDLLGDYETSWICADNTVIPDFNKEKLVLVIAKIMKDKTANVQNAMRHKTALMESDNPESYDYSTGWTPTYVDFVKEKARE